MHFSSFRGPRSSGGAEEPGAHRPEDGADEKPGAGLRAGTTGQPAESSGDQEAAGENGENVFGDHARSRHQLSRKVPPAILKLGRLTSDPALNPVKELELLRDR